ncbi:glycosyltransferase family 4 protein [Pontibacter sp. BT310]|uniref:Glycosyltransferase family 4 protein n=1 Tax=Pontibacter populi TaxID=890055 RepID=A0ABS6XDJ1_9BACT|nr:MULTISPECIES: glycosyltransferase [Pontibacter]MBJ6119206.1 glycosyltransferase family 4 protein [Pontibacter sp. BT310]MBR0571634.1 glycosyltransferase family 4 protein [Microvirga sp. STS03]MBW3366060.1 glycosyltransferase family 4 protein [Pontibacter populi]
MKLLFVHDHPFFQELDKVYSGGGLPGKVWSNYLKYFRKVHVFARRSRNKKDKKVISTLDDNSVVFELTERYSSTLSLLINFRRLYKQIYLQVHKADVILIRLPSVLSFIAGFICIKSNKPFIVEQVGNAKEAMITHGSLKGKIISSIFESINRWMVKRASYVSYVTQKKLQIDYPTNGVSASISDVDITRTFDNNDIDKERFFQQKVKIGLIGGFDAKYKGQDVLLRAISLLNNNLRGQIELYFVGKGDHTWIIDLANRLELAASIKFIGPKESGKEILDFLSTLSLYIQPSLTEGMPRALLEAMSVGCPVMGSKVGGIPDIIDNEFLHDAKDFRSLSEQINKVINDREILYKQSLRSIELIKPFAKEKLDEKRDSFYQSIVKDLSLKLA